MYPLTGRVREVERFAARCKQLAPIEWHPLVLDGGDIESDRIPQGEVRHGSMCRDAQFQPNTS